MGKKESLGDRIGKFLLICGVGGLICAGGWLIWPSGVFDRPLGQITLAEMFRGIFSAGFWMLGVPCIFIAFE